MTTRAQKKHCIYGTATQMIDTQLPLIKDILRHILFFKHHSPNDDPFVATTRAVIDIWIRASLPTITEKSVTRKMKQYFEEGKTLMRSKTTKRDNFEEKINFLFDISRCRCDDMKTCQCAYNDKIPVDEREFVVDQRGPRRMVIGAIDQRGTALNQRRMKRNLTTSTTPTTTTPKIPRFESETSPIPSDSQSDSPSDDDSEPSLKAQTPRLSRLMKICNIALQADRLGPYTFNWLSSNLSYFCFFYGKM
jgi:hypothetical protein